MRSHLGVLGVVARQQDHKQEGPCLCRASHREEHPQQAEAFRVHSYMHRRKLPDGRVHPAGLIFAAQHTSRLSPVQQHRHTTVANGASSANFITQRSADAVYVTREFDNRRVPLPVRAGKACNAVEQPGLTWSVQAA
jgi:hypothetical protein